MRRPALAVLALIALAGCSNEAPSTPAPPSAASASTPAAPETGEFGAPIVTEPPSFTATAPPADQWVTTTDLATTDANMIEAMGEYVGPSSANLTSARDIAYFVCSSLRYDPTQADFQPVLDIFGTMEVPDALFVGLASQRYCLDTAG